MRKNDERNKRRGVAARGNEAEALVAFAVEPRVLVTVWSPKPFY